MNDQPVPQAQDTAASADLPSIESSGGREGRFRAHDGAVIRYAWWLCEAATPRGTLLFFNGRTEFIEKNIETVGELLARGFDVWTLDWRGQGLSQRALANRSKGHIEDYKQHLDDLSLLFRDHLRPRAPGPWTLLAHSMGGHIALRLLGVDGDRFSKAVLTSPLVDIYGSNALVRGGTHVVSWFGALPGVARAYVPGFGDYGEKQRLFVDNPLTSDETRFRRMHAYIDAKPDLALGGPTLGWLHATRCSTATLCRPAFGAAIRTPLLLLSAGEDRVVSNDAHRAFVSEVPDCRHETIEGALHEILIERDSYRAQFWRLFDDFVLGSGEQPGGAHSA